MPGGGEKYAIVTGEWDGLPCVAVVNEALVGFEDKSAYEWHLSVVIDAQEVAEKGMPTQSEVLLLDAEGDRIQGAVCLDGAALFLARTTWNGNRRLHFRVRNPESTNAVLQRIVALGGELRPWDYKMWRDPGWEQATWFFSPWTA